MAGDFFFFFFLFLSLSLSLPLSLSFSSSLSEFDHSVDDVQRLPALPSGLYDFVMKGWKWKGNAPRPPNTHTHTHGRRTLVTPAYCFRNSMGVLDYIPLLCKHEMASSSSLASTIKELRRLAGTGRSMPPCFQRPGVCFHEYWS